MKDPIIIGKATIMNCEEALLLSRYQRYRLRKKGVFVPFVTRLLGHKQSAEHIRKKSEAKKNGRHFNCLVCNAEFWRSLSRIKNGDCKFCSRSCYLAWQIGRPKSEEFKLYCRTRTGDKSPTWKGGITPENLRIRNSAEYIEWRISVFLRDNHECQHCHVKCGNGKDVYLHAHHIKSFSKHPDLRFELSNGITLCKECHYKEHSK